LFALYSALADVPNSLALQRQIIVASFGFSTLRTTLLTCVDGGLGIITILTGVNIVAHTSNTRAYVGVIFLIPPIIGVFLVLFLPWSDKVGLLFGIWLNVFSGTSFSISLSWLTSVTSGHTKRITTNAIMLCAFCVGNAVGPFMWQAQYYPRNTVPWVINGICFLCCIVILLTIRFVLSRENKRRDSEPRDETYDNVYVTRETADGKKVTVKVAREFLDLTDRQNRDFRYVL